MMCHLSFGNTRHPFGSQPISFFCIPRFIFPRKTLNNPPAACTGHLRPPLWATHAKSAIPIPRNCFADLGLARLRSLPIPKKVAASQKKRSCCYPNTSCCYPIPNRNAEQQIQGSGFEALWKYPAQMALRTMSQSVPGHATVLLVASNPWNKKCICRSPGKKNGGPIARACVHLLPEIDKHMSSGDRIQLKNQQGKRTTHSEAMEAMALLCP